MPTLHKLSVFRDDLIFVIYIYHTRTHSLSLSLCLSVTHLFSLSLTHTPTHTHKHKHTHSLSLTRQMPTLHKLSVFRDDLIFVIYIYQRWAYQVDRTRVNEYGPTPVSTSFTEEEFFIDNLLVRIHFIIEMILVDRLCAMGV